MICKSFIPNLNLIDPADLRMHPPLGVSAACERCVWGEEIRKEQTAVQRLQAGTGHKPGVEPVSSGGRGQLSPPTAPRIVFTAAAAASYRGVFAEGGWDEGRGGSGVRIERSVPRVWTFGGGGGGRSDWGAYGATTGGNGLFSTQHMPSLPQAAQLPQSSRLRREIWFQMWSASD